MAKQLELFGPAVSVTPAIRRQLENDTFAHRWLCHPERDCEDGCDMEPIPERLRVYLDTQHEAPNA